MAGGMYTKQAVYLGARFLNDVNDATVGGAISTAPSGLTVSQGQQTLPGDRIVVDDATALALSDTAVGTLWGGIYEYVVSKAASTAAPAVGLAAFFIAADIGNASPSVAYEVTPDANPTTAVPTFFQGVYISAVTKGNACWIQVAGIANCLFDSALTATANGAWVTVKVSATVPSTFDSGAVAGVVTLAAAVGVGVGLPATSTLSKVVITRGIGRL